MSLWVINSPPETSVPCPLTSMAYKLPVGTIHATGNGLVPAVDQQLYDQISALVGGEPGVISASLPKSSAQLAPGHLVIAQATVEDGWWPAIIIKKSSEAVGRRVSL